MQRALHRQLAGRTLHDDECLRGAVLSAADLNAVMPLEARALALHVDDRQAGQQRNGRVEPPTFSVPSAGMDRRQMAVDLR